MNHVLSEER